MNPNSIFPIIWSIFKKADYANEQHAHISIPQYFKMISAKGKMWLDGRRVWRDKQRFEKVWPFIQKQHREEDGLDFIRDSHPVV